MGSFTGGRRVRLVRQTEMTECGLACLAMVAGSYALEVDLGTLRRRFQPSMRGASLKSLIAMADAMGLSARAVKLALEDMKDLHTPAVLHWDMNHFVVLEQVRRGKALIHNPDGRSKCCAFVMVGHSSEAQISELSINEINAVNGAILPTIGAAVGVAVEPAVAAPLVTVAVVAVVAVGVGWGIYEATH